MMVTVTEGAEKDSRIAARAAELAPLKERCKTAGVTHDAIAAKLECTRPFVVNVFAGRKKAPIKLVNAAIALCKRAERRAGKKSSRQGEPRRSAAGALETSRTA
jgi:hypothetical protein